MVKRDPIKVYDARWEVSEFNSTEVHRLLEAIYIYGRYLGIDTVTIAKDTRLAGSSVMEQAVDIGMKSGLQVYLCTDPVSTTQSYFMAFKVSLEHPKTLGLTITASHNPANHIGIKITVPGTQAIGLDCGPLGGFSKIREIIHSDETIIPADGADLYIVNYTKEYIDFAMETAGVTKNMLNGISVVLDSFNGAAGPELYRALKKSGAKVIPLRLVPDGYFPTGSPNPVSRGKMKNAISIAKDIRESIVIGTDGDGDRLVFGDYRGILNAGFSSIPILGILCDPMEKGQGTTDKGNFSVFDPKVNPVALNEWKKFGIVPRLYRNGHSQIKEYMKDIDAIAAIEESGHFYHKLKLKDKTMYGENSLVSILLFLRAMRSNSSMMDMLWNLQRQVFTTGEFNYCFKNNEIRDKAMDEVLVYFKDKNVMIETKSLEGIDLQGTLVSNGTDPQTDSQVLDGHWYSGYFRVSTSENNILRSYLSSGDIDLVKGIEHDIIEICKKYSGREVE